MDFQLERSQARYWDEIHPVDQHAQLGAWVCAGIVLQELLEILGQARWFIVPFQPDVEAVTRPSDAVSSAAPSYHGFLPGS